MRVLPLLVVLSITSVASADAIGGACPSGQIYQANPVQPGAMHHGGGQCVADPSASHCAASPGHAPSTLWPLLGLAVVIARRVRVAAR